MTPFLPSNEGTGKRLQPTVPPHAQVADAGMAPVAGWRAGWQRLRSARGVLKSGTARDAVGTSAHGQAQHASRCTAQQCGYKQRR
jgi:hypothetical protein